MAKRLGNPNPPTEQLKATQFKPGQSGNPSGNAGSLRQKLQHEFTKALRDDFLLHGNEAIQACRETKPEAYVKAIAGMLPRELEIKRPLEDLNDEQLIAAVAALQSFLAASGSKERAGDEAGAAQAH